MTIAPRDTQNALWTPIAWGVLVGVLQAASPLAFWWLEPATVYALSLVAIAFVYIGFAVADGRWKVIALETSVAAIMAIEIVAGLNLHG